MKTNLPVKDDGQYLQFVVEVEKISKLQVSKIGRMGSVQEQTLEGSDKKVREAIVLQYMRDFYELGVNNTRIVYQGCHKLAFNTTFESACDVNLLYCMQETQRLLDEGSPVLNSDEILTALSIFYMKSFELREEDNEFLLMLRQYLKPDCQKLIDYFSDSFVYTQQIEIPQIDQGQKYFYQTIYESEVYEEEEQIRESVVDMGDQIVNFEKAKTIPEEIEKISVIVTKVSVEALTWEETGDLSIWYQQQIEKEEEKKQEGGGQEQQEKIPLSTLFWQEQYLKQKEEKRSHMAFDMSEYLEFPGNATMVRGARSDDVDRRKGGWNLTQYSEEYLPDLFEQDIQNELPQCESLMNLDLTNIYFEQFFDQDDFYWERSEIQQRCISWRDGAGTFYTYDTWNGQSFVNSGSPLDTYSQLIFCFCNNIPDFLLDDDLKQLSLKRDKNVRYDHLVKAMKALEHITEKQILIYLCVKEIFFKSIRLKVSNAPIVSFLYLTCNLQEVQDAIILIECTAFQEKLVTKIDRDLEDILKEMLFFKVVRVNGLIIKQDYLYNRICKDGNQYMMFDEYSKRPKSFEVKRFKKI